MTVVELGWGRLLWYPRVTKESFSEEMTDEAQRETVKWRYCGENIPGEETGELTSQGGAYKWAAVWGDGQSRGLLDGLHSNPGSAVEYL